MQLRTSAWLGGLAIGFIGCTMPAQDVHGVAMYLQVAEDGIEPQTRTPWTGHTIEVLSPIGAGYERRFAEVDAKGEFFISDVPSGPFWVAFPNEVSAFQGESKLYAWTESRELDLGYTHFGLGFPSAFRKLPVEITQLLPAQAEDWIEVYSTSLHWFATFGLPTPGADKAMWPNDAVISLRSHPSERIIAKQWRAATQDGVRSEATVRAGSVAAPDETATALTIPLADSEPRTFSVNVDDAAFTAELAPLSRPSSGWWRLQLNTVSAPQEPMAPRQMLLRATPSDPARDANLSGLAYSDPYPVGWPRKYTLTYMSGRTYPVPEDTLLKASCGTGLQMIGDTSALAHDILRPRLSLPQGLEIDGQDAQQDSTQVSASPTIRWRAPRIGAVSFYMLRLVRIAKLEGRATPENEVGRFLTTATEINIPEGVLKAGEQYFFELTALSGSDIDAKAAPRRAALLDRIIDSAHLCSGGIHL